VSADLLELADKLRYDLTAAQVKLSELKKGLAALPNVPEKTFSCPECGGEVLPWIRSQSALEEHRYVSHGVEAGWVIEQE
jgi:hypothetical protein